MSDMPADFLFFALNQWCSVTKAWLALPGHYDSTRQAEDAATERGIYRVVCVYNGQRLGMEPFAKIGRDECCREATLVPPQEPPMPARLYGHVPIEA